MECSKCGAEVREGTRFCGKCGEPVASAGRCLNCGADLGPHTRFCASCGAPTGARASAASTPAPQRPSAAPPPASKAGKGGLGKTLLVLLALLVLAGGAYYAINSLGVGRSGTAAPATAGQPPAPQGPSGGAAGTSQPIAAKPTTAAWASPTASATGKAAPTIPPTAVPAKPNLGTASFKPPAADSVITTADWGQVPANQITIMLKEGLKRSDADGVAKAVGGSVVGEFAYINLYQIEVPAKTETELRSAIDKAKATTGVEQAFPVQQAIMDAEIKGARCSALNDPLYSGENGKPFQMIGLQEAWTLIKASGAPMSDVQVGVTDDGLYKGKEEFGGKSSFETSEGEDQLPGAYVYTNSGKEVPYGSHGTAVTGIIGADPDNGGMAGVASVLGNKLKVKMTNVFGNSYGSNTAAAPDPSDPTKYTAPTGATWAIGDLVAIKKQVEGGATIINCSWGNSNSSPALAQAYKKFFEKMSRDHPNVLFVCSAGNDGKSLDGTKRFPSGLNLPNMITVGCLDNDGSRVHYSNMASPNFEVTLAAPGHRVVSGVGPDGSVSNVNGGTSFATPQVTAAAAILRSLNPKLSAGDIKKILSETAGTEVTTGGKPVKVDASVGGKVLRVDNAVLRVLNDLRATRTPPLPPLNKETLEKLGVIDAVAKSDKPGEYSIVASVGAVNEGGTDVKIELWGEGAIGGSTTKHLAAAGDVTWSLSIVDLKQKPAVKVTRADNGACSTIQLAPIDMAGTWNGTMAITDVSVNTDTITIPDPFGEGEPTVITREQCEQEMKENLNKDQKMVMEFAPSSAEAGMVTFGGGTSEGSSVPYRLSGDWLTIDYIQEGWNTHMEGQVAEADQEYTLRGTMRITVSGEGVTMIEIKGHFAVSKPK